MAFVYCNERWKNNKENNFPGPCQYSVDQESSCELTQNAASRLLKSMKKARQIRKNIETPAQKCFKEVIDHKNVIVDKNDSSTQLRTNVKKGKLYRNQSLEIKKNQQTFIEQHTELKIMIKNALHNQSNVGNRNKWGNMRIKEMLNEHREKELKKNAFRPYNKQNKTVLLVDNKEKLKQQFKQLQNIFTTQRKGCNIHLKNINKRKSPAKAFLAHNFSQNQLRYSEPSKEDLQIHPSAVYVSDKYSYDPQVYIRNDDSITPITPTCSIGTSKLGNKQKSIPTAYSMEYISDATPGPGSYNIHNETSKISTRIQKFGVTMERFKPERVPLTHALVAPAIPDYKVSTNARQQDVGFGRTTKESKMKSNNTHNGAFYEDYATLQHKSLKNRYKLKKDNLCFDSCKERFPQYQQNKLSIQSDDEPSQEEEQVSEELIEKPTSNFLSKVNRQLEYMTNTTENADFSGQNYNCIANKLKKQKQYLEDYDLEPAPFLTNSKRFIYKEAKPEEKREQLLGIKIQQLKKKKEIKRKIEQKGYTFSKQTKQDFDGPKVDQIPSPDHYEKSPNWIKPSYNIRFN